MTICTPTEPQSREMCRPRPLPGEELCRGELPSRELFLRSTAVATAASILDPAPAERVTHGFEPVGGNGWDGGTRTPDPLINNQPLYQLSYIPSGVP